ncbi:MAG: STAS domain-containing protein [Syntrophaceae bacterium]|nr:STAS domain-containing protein [Syntrophaceae bacterium]
MQIKQDNGITIIQTDERLDSLDGPKLKDVIGALTENKGLRLIVDMEQTTFIDSSGLEGLLSSLKLVMARHGDIKIARPTPQAFTLLKLTRMHKIFDIHDDLINAIKSFNVKVS